MKRVARGVCRTMASLLLIGVPLASALGADETASFPNRPFRIVVPFTPGGQPDIVSRLIQPRLSEYLGQQVVVDNRPGAGGLIGGRIVAGAAPDGYTLLVSSAAISIQPATRLNLGYHPLEDFRGISQVASAAYYLVVSNSLNVKTVKDLIALAKAKPGQLNFSSAGTGSATHFGAELFRFTAGIDMVHVPHRGIPEALTDTMAGRTQFFMAPYGSTVGLLKEGRLRALAVSTAQRSRVTPDIPTIAESGVARFSLRLVERHVRAGQDTARDRQPAEPGSRAHSQAPGNRAAAPRHRHGRHIEHAGGARQIHRTAGRRGAGAGEEGGDQAGVSGVVRAEGRKRG